MLKTWFERSGFEGVQVHVRNAEEHYLGMCKHGITLTANILHESWNEKLSDASKATRFKPEPQH